MSVKPLGNYVVAGTLSILAVPVLYLLSVPPMMRCVGVTMTPDEIGYYPLMDEWKKRYCAPYAWTMKRTPLHEALDTYAQLWGLAHAGPASGY